MRVRPGLLAVLACFSGGGMAQDNLPAPRLKFEHALSETHAAADEGRPIFVSGDQFEGRADRDATLTGNAQLRSAGTVITADRLTYYPEDDEVAAVGNVRAFREGNVFAGPELQLKLDANEGYFASPEYELGRFGGRGRASRAEFLGPQRMRLYEAVYTTCVASDPDWYLRTRELEIDQSKEEGEGKDGQLVFKGRNVLWAPAFSFPLTDERRSGFLAPTFQMNSRTGFQVLSPYYFNLAPNRDLTVYNRLMTRNGYQFGSWLRYMEPNYYGELRLELNPHDRNTGTTRYFYGTTHTVRNLMGWTAGWNVRGVSDDNYFVDYSASILNSAERNLPRDVYAMRAFGDWNLTVRATRYQNILTARLGPAYERVPQVTANYAKYDYHGFDVTTLVDVANFRRPLIDSAEGLRSVVNPQIAYPITRPGWFLTPRAGLHLTNYQMSNDPAYNGDSYSRALPTVSLEGGLIFERPSSLFGRDATQTLEPRLFYTYTPYRDQSRMPVFDSGVADLSFAQLFSSNTFVGNDRIADTNQLTAAVVSRFIRPDTGIEALRLAFGQRYYFSQQRVTLPGIDNTTDRRSDLLFAASGELSPEWNFDSGLQYSLADKTFPRANIGVRHTTRDGKILNLSVRYLRESIGQFDVAWRQPVARRWMTLGRVNYSFLKSGVDPLTALPVGPGLVEGLFGVEYREDCWLLRLVVQRYVTAASTRTTAFFAQIEFSGLGTLGTNPADAIRRNIPGYRLSNERPELPSRYFGYE